MSHIPTRDQRERQPRKAAGAFATFYHLRREGMTTAEAHTCVRRWSLEVRSSYAPNPLCMVTRRDLTAYYDRPGYKGD